MRSSRYAAFDLGAESGRVLLGTFDDDLLTLDELHRFPNEPVRTNGELHWDILRLWHEVLQGLSSLAHTGIAELNGLGVDTWGVDFALMGEGGRLLGNPYHYRDARTDGIPEEVFRRVPPEDIYEQTGIQFMPINSLFQLFAAAKHTPKILAAAEQLLTIPDLLNFWLTGTMACEFTNATTTQMFNPRTGTWARDLLSRLGLPARILGDVIQPGTAVGSLRHSLLRQSGLDVATVIAPACHDTGSAVAAISMTGRSAFISSGTWSLMGTEVAAPVITPQARAMNFTNEGGVAGTYRLLKNIAGMWLLQECRRKWRASGRDYTYADMVGMAHPEPVLESLIDPNHPSFLHPEDMTEAISQFCTRTGQPAPSRAAAFVQIILESLALSYRHVLRQLESLTGTVMTEIRVVGGGARNQLLNQLIADATGQPVIAGPVEATALGNIGVQMWATGAVSSIAEARGLIDRSFPTERYEPRQTDKWDGAYARFQQYCEIDGKCRSVAGDV